MSLTRCTMCGCAVDHNGCGCDEEPDDIGSDWVFPGGLRRMGIAKLKLERQLSEAIDGVVKAERLRIVARAREIADELSEGDMAWILRDFARELEEAE